MPHLPRPVAVAGLHVQLGDGDVQLHDRTTRARVRDLRDTSNETDILKRNRCHLKYVHDHAADIEHLFPHNLMLVICHWPQANHHRTLPPYICKTRS
jgi:hypothetical protein